MASKEPTEMPTTSGEKNSGKKPRVQRPECGHGGVINPHEAEEHRHKMDRAKEELKRSAEEEEFHEIMKDIIENIKAACTVIHTQMADEDVLKVLHSMGDPYDLALQRN